MKNELINGGRLWSPPISHQQFGASLIMVMLILVVVSLLGVGAAQISLMSERSARNDRDQLIAWQSAEAALNDAEFDMFKTRRTLFDGQNAIPFVSGCGTSGNSQGLCAAISTGKPSWLTVDFTSTAESAPTTLFGQFTLRDFSSGGVGIQPAKKPRYIIELVRDPSGDASKVSYLYQVTSMGFGPREDTQAVLQILYRN